MKGTHLLTICVCSLAWVCNGLPAKLLRVPKIYNALITSNEMLIPSQAYPAVSPVLRPAVGPVYYAHHEQHYTPNNKEDFGVGPENHFFPPNLEDLRPMIVKNNRPSNKEIPDVPPPPVPGVKKPSSPVKPQDEDYQDSQDY